MKHLAFRFAVFVMAAVIAVPVCGQSALEELEKQQDEQLAEPSLVLPPPPGPSEPHSENPVAQSADEPVAQPPEAQETLLPGEPGYLGVVADQSRGRPGVRILSVRAGGPSDQAGMKPGDHIMTINQQPIDRLGDLIRFMQSTRAGNMVSVEISRSGVRLLLEFPLGQQIDRGPSPMISAGGAHLGVIVSPVTEQIGQRVAARQGALVRRVIPGSPADQYGLPVGAVIVKLDDIQIHSPNDLIAEIAISEPGRNVELIYYIGRDRYRQQARLGSQASLGSRNLSVERLLGVEPPLRLVPPTPDADGVPQSLADPPSLQKLEKQLSAPDQPVADGLAEVARLRSEVVDLREQVRVLQEQLDRTNQLLRELPQAPADG